MKRPLVLVGFCYLLTLAAAIFLGADISFMLLWCCAGGFAVTALWKKTRRAVILPLAFAASTAALVSFCVYYRFSVEPPRALDGKNLNVEGTVCELPERRYGRWYYIVRVDKTDFKSACVPRGFKVRISLQNGLNAGPYSRVKGKIHFFLPSGGDGFSSRGYYASKGVMMFAWPDGGAGVTILPAAEKPPYYYAMHLRQKLISAVQDMLPQQEASLVNGILLGDKSGLHDNLVSDFRTDGISHLLSVSGLHMSTIAELLIFMLLFFHVPKRMAAGITACGILGFMAVTCFVPSVTRSGIMCLLCLAAPIISRRSDPLNSLCTAVLIICIANPYAAADVGLLLSFFATLGLILLAGPAADFLNKKLDRIHAISPLVRGINGTLATSVGASLFTLPVILLSFGTVSAVAPLANILELVPASVLMALGAAAAALHLLLPQTGLAMPFALAAGLIAKYMRLCASWLAGLPFASLSASQGFVIIWLGGTFLLFSAALAIGKGTSLFPQTACLSAIMLFTGIFSFRLCRQNVTRIAFLDVGNDVSTVLTRDGHAAVIGCGSYQPQKIISYLGSENVTKIDCLEILTEERDEFSCAADIAERYHPACLLVHKGSMADGFVGKAAANAGRTETYDSSAAMNFWSDVSVKTCRAGRSSAAMVTAGGISAVAFPPEADGNRLPLSWRTPDVLAYGASEKNVGGINPSCVVFSMNKTTLQKSAETVKKCRSAWTGGYGNIILEVKGNRRLSIGREP